jgi:arabinose-5-phosphate isomerase
LDRPVQTVMTVNPLKTIAGAMMTEAVALMAQRKISELPVVDTQGRPVGLIDITDVVGLLPRDAADGKPVAGGKPAAGNTPCRLFPAPEEESE